MRNLFVGFSVLILVLSLSATSLFAESEDVASENLFKEKAREKKMEIKQDVMQKKQEVRSEFKEKEASKRAEVKDKVAEKRLEMLNKRFTYLSRHLNAFYTRLGKIEEKIKTRISKLKERGVDTSAAESKLAEVEPLKTAAKTAIDKAILDSQSVGSAEDPKTATETAVSSVRAAKAALFSYHKKLVEVIRELKAPNALREGSGSANEE